VLATVENHRDHPVRPTIEFAVRDAAGRMNGRMLVQAFDPMREHAA
jgi:hypothetical protein